MRFGVIGPVYHRADGRQHFRLGGARFWSVNDAFCLRWRSGRPGSSLGRDRAAPVSRWCPQLADAQRSLRVAPLPKRRSTVNPFLKLPAATCVHEELRSVSPNESHASMLIQVVHCHPFVESFDHALYRTIVATLKQTGHKVVRITREPDSARPRWSPISSISASQR